MVSIIKVFPNLFTNFVRNPPSKYSTGRFGNLTKTATNSMFAFDICMPLIS